MDDFVSRVYYTSQDNDRPSKEEIIELCNYILSISFTKEEYLQNMVNDMQPH